MSKTVKVTLSRSYGWHDEAGNYVEYGPGDVPIPLDMAQGLVKAGVLASLPEERKGEDVHPRIFAQREADASARTVKAMTKFLKLVGLDEQAELLAVKSENGDEQQVLRNEAVAESLETLLKTAPTNVGDLVGEAARPAEEAVGQRLKEAAKQGREALLAVIEELPGIGPKSIAAISSALGDTPPTENLPEGSVEGETPPQVGADDKAEPPTGESAP